MIIICEEKHQFSCVLLATKETLPADEKRKIASGGQSSFDDWHSLTVLQAPTSAMMGRRFSNVKQSTSTFIFLGTLAFQLYWFFTTQWCQWYHIIIFVLMSTWVVILWLIFLSNKHEHSYNVDNCIIYTLTLYKIWSKYPQSLNHGMTFQCPCVFVCITKTIVSTDYLTCDIGRT